MKKVFAVIVALVFAVSLSVPAAAAGRGTSSGQMTPFRADYDPQAVSDLLGGFDISGIVNDLGVGDLSSLMGDFDIGSLLGDFDIGSLLGDFDIGSLLGGGGDFDIMGTIMGLFGCGGDSGDGETTTEEDTSEEESTDEESTDEESTDEETTEEEESTDSPEQPAKDLGDNSGSSIAVALGVMTVAAAAAFCTRKKEVE